MLTIKIIENNFSKRFLNLLFFFKFNCLQIEKKYQVLDSVVINNPVNTLKGSIADATKMDLDDMYNKYLTIPFRLSQSAAPFLAKSP